MLRHLLLRYVHPVKQSVTEGYVKYCDEQKLSRDDAVAMYCMEHKIQGNVTLLETAGGVKMHDIYKRG